MVTCVQLSLSTAHGQDFVCDPQGFMEAPVDGGGVSVGGCAATLAGQHDHSSMAAQILAKVGEAMTRAGRFMETLQGFR